MPFTDENRPDPVDPVALAPRSQGANAKAATETTSDYLAGHHESGFDLLAVPTPHPTPSLRTPGRRDLT